ncbi:protein FAR1-RELATED SEQUENCE 5-like isoform X2 [Cornus florida]|uniref:protein FAR1-RELATED SEQUENCE 5-like isoform X2 n=1 Tax=Cornus florida TaxID=4283 RepID=UPI0028A13462|nr:protein FAR1-RELATED SEQUENCE 5-like isoform X2 [Cornus florida]
MASKGKPITDNDIVIDSDVEIIAVDNGDSSHITHQNDSDLELKVGISVPSEEEAYNLYNSYAINKGFSVRKGKVRRREGTTDVRQRVFLCSCEGFSEDAHLFPDKKVERMLARTGCNARAIFNVEDGKWKLVQFISEHNHPFVKPEQRHLLRSGRKMLDPCTGFFSSIPKNSITVTKTHSYLSREGNGVQNVMSIERDHHNCLQSQRSKAMDVQSLINYFMRKQSEDPMFFYTMKVDDQNRIANFFWRDGLSKLDYHCFGDVVIFDSTYRTNKYNMICVPFVGVNHHWKNVLLGCAFLSDETISSFVWLFEAFLEVMGNKAPKTIFTNQDNALSIAIQKVFPSTRHRLCTWHISKNAVQNVSTFFTYLGFKEKFAKLLNDCETDTEFESTWNSMNEEWSILGNEWLRKLYDLREKWCPAFNHDTFSANITSTQRSESENNIFEHVACNTMTLTEFVQYYEESASRMREVEVNDDFLCAKGKPQILVPNNGILMHASEVYTDAIFKMFQDEFLKGVNEDVVHVETKGPLVVYTLRGISCPRERIVHFHKADLSLNCSCQMFESLGWLCRHALRVLNLNAGVQKIPSQYVLNRWTKGVKEGIVIDDYGESFQNITASSKTVRFNKLMCKAFNVTSISADNDETTAIADAYLDCIVDEVRKLKAENVMGHCDPNADGCDTDIHCSVGEKVVLDPPRMSPKGVTHDRPEGCSEKKKKNKRAIGEGTTSQTAGYNNAMTAGLNLNQFLFIYAVSPLLWHAEFACK